MIVVVLGVLRRVESPLLVIPIPAWSTLSPNVAARQRRHCRESGNPGAKQSQSTWVVALVLRIVDEQNATLGLRSLYRLSRDLRDIAFCVYQNWICFPLDSRFRGNDGVTKKGCRIRNPAALIRFNEISAVTIYDDGEQPVRPIPTARGLRVPG